MAKESYGPTQLDWQGFSSISISERARCLYLYLHEGYVMEDVADIVYDDKTYSQRVSQITRCFGFGGRNTKYYGKKYPELTEDDYMALVSAFPDGCDDWDRHRPVDKFMEKRHQLHLSGDDEQECYEDDNPYFKNVSGSFRPPRNERIERTPREIAIIVIVGLAVIIGFASIVLGSLGKGILGLAAVIAAILGLLKVRNMGISQGLRNLLKIPFGLAVLVCFIKGYSMAMVVILVVGVLFFALTSRD